jgi:hypothetical protein
VLPSEALVPIEWERTDGVLADAASGVPLPLEHLRIRQFRQLLGDGVALSSFGDPPIPLVTRSHVGRGTAHFLATLPLRDWSNLENGSVLVPMTYRLVLEGGKRLQNAVMGSCGDWSVGRESAPVDPVDPETDYRTDAGVYQYQGQVVALNTPLVEALQPRLGKEDTASVFEGLSLKHLRHDQSSVQSRGHREIWAFFLWLLLVFLLLERLLTIPPIQMESKVSIDV